MEDENILMSLFADTENIINDILLSGYHSLQSTTLDRLRELEQIYNQMGLEEGTKLLSLLIDGLNQRKNSFEFDLNQITKLFCTLEFYLRNAREQLG